MNRYRFAITVRTDDLAALHCLRGLVHYCQQSGSDKMKAWSGTGREEWEADDHQVTFHFSDPKFRAKFASEGTRLLPGLWEKISERDGP